MPTQLEPDTCNVKPQGVHTHNTTSFIAVPVYWVRLTH